MIRSLFSGISGIRSNQLSLEAIGSNIANINTPGFKSGRASFSDTLSLTLRNGTAPTETQGGLNPMQMGGGSSLAAIDTIFTQGSIDATNNPTDLAIAGDGFFVLREGQKRFYTRDGSFGFDATGRLVDPATGLAVQGRMANESGEIFSSTPITDIILPIGSLFPALATSNVAFAGNLNATAEVADTGGDGIDVLDNAYQTSVSVYDSLGDIHTVIIAFGLTDTPNQWTWEATLSSDDTNTITSSASGTLHFNADGTIDGTVPAELAVDLVLSGSAGAGNPLDSGAAEQTISLNFEGLVQFAGSFSPVATSRDGHGIGSLESVGFDETGTLIGTFSNGATQFLAQLILADFNNPAGLTKVGENLYNVSMNSGVPLIGVAGSSIRAAIVPGSLESSNVDLATEFVKMMIAQRGFEANSRVVTTSDSILGELINLKR